MASKILPQVTAVVVKNILLMAYGLGLGYTTILIPGLLDPKESFNIGTEGLSWIASIQSIFVPIGCLISGTVMQAIGRRKSMQFVNIPFIISWFIFYFCDSEWQILAALSLFGLTGGFMEAPIITYVAEISEPHLRGILSSTSAVAVVLGVMIMFCLGAAMNWRTVAIVSSVVNVISFICLFFIPESPHWLISKNKLQNARSSLAWLRGCTSVKDIEPEYKQIYMDVYKKEFESGDNAEHEIDVNQERTLFGSNAQGLNKMKPYFKKSFLWPYCLITFMFSLSHFGGMHTIQTYAVQIFATFNSPLDKYHCTIIMGVSELLGTICSVWTIYYAGKRLLNFISLIANGFVFMVIGTYAYCMRINYLHFPKSINGSLVQPVEIDKINDSGFVLWIPLIFIVSLVFFTHIGIKVIPWILIGEVFSSETRSMGAGLCGATTYIMAFIVNKNFYNAVEFLTLPILFWCHATISFVGCMIIYFVQPETEGHTLSEIQEHFSGDIQLVTRKFSNYEATNRPNNTIPRHVNNYFSEECKTETSL